MEKRGKKKKKNIEKNYELAMTIFVIKRKPLSGKAFLHFYETTLEDSGHGSENLIVIYKRQYISQRFSSF